MQGEINAQVSKLADQPEALKAFMADKTDREKRLARIHLKTVMRLRKRK